MKPTAQSCAACKWWKRYTDMNALGNCHAPLPESIKAQVQYYLGNNHMTAASFGTQCECFKKGKQ